MSEVCFEKFSNVNPLFEVNKDSFLQLREQVIGETPRSFVSAALKVTETGAYDTEEHIGPLSHKKMRRFEALARPIIDRLFDLGFCGQKKVALRRLEANKTSTLDPEWHIDNHVENGFIILASDVLPTQFVVGEANSDSPVVLAKKNAYEYYDLGVNAVGKVDADLKLNQEVSDELNKTVTCLELVNAPLYSLNYIPNDVVHRSHPMSYTPKYERLMIMIEERLPIGSNISVAS